MKKNLFLLLPIVAFNLFVAAQNVGIGTTTPAYKLEVVGPLHITNDAYFDGNVGVGTVAPAVKLDVAGGGNFTGTLTVLGDMNAAGDVTAHGGGVVYNTQATTNLKVYRRTAAFTVTGLAAHTLSAEGTVDIGGNYTEAPSVFVGDITSTGGTAGPLFQLQLVTYGANTNSFKIRILNNSNFVISQSITWNIMCVGD